MTRLPSTPEMKLSAEMQARYEQATKPRSGMSATFQAYLIHFYADIRYGQSNLSTVRIIIYG